MKSTTLHLAMRETQAAMWSSRTQTVLLAVAVILGLAGPFGTAEVMRLVPRIVYWLAVCEVTFACGSFISQASDHFKPRFHGSEHLFAAVVGLIIGVVIAIEIFLFNWAIFGISPLRAGYALTLVSNVVIVAVIIRVAISLLRQNTPDTTIAAPQDAPPAPKVALVERLPYDKRGPLISLSVNDHYVDVVTTKGQEMLLMRLADAIREAGDGLQVHRSHWVARDHIISVTRDGAKAVIKTSDGRDIPVSRTYVPMLKEAGFLP